MDGKQYRLLTEIVNRLINLFSSGGVSLLPYKTYLTYLQDDDLGKKKTIKFYRFKLDLILLYVTFKPC